MIDIPSGTVEERIVRLLLARYPISTIEIAKILKIPEPTVKKTIHAFAARGIVTLDVLPDTEYVRLSRMDFRFVGSKATQKKALKHSRTKTRRRRKQTEDTSGGMMYQ